MFDPVCYTIFQMAENRSRTPGGALAPGVRVKSDGGAKAPPTQGEPFYGSDSAKNTGGGSSGVGISCFLQG